MSDGKIKYVHTNLVALDWKALAAFYTDVFDCVALPPERHLSGLWIDRMTGITGVGIDGVHLALPGYENGPTLEVFQYKPEVTGADPKEINQPGFGHIAFHVEDVQGVLASVIAHGGGQLGEIIEKEYESLGKLTAVYAKDPEGNCIEIQNWYREVSHL